MPHELVERFTRCRCPHCSASQMLNCGDTDIDQGSRVAAAEQAPRRWFKFRISGAARPVAPRNDTPPSLWVRLNQCNPP